MGHSSLRVVVLHNCDFANADRVDVGDVVNAARDVAGALRARGCEVTTLPVDDGDALTCAHRAVLELRKLQPDLVFNLCESLAGDSRNELVVPALLELAGLRYTGSGPLALGVALRKDLTKKLLRADGVSTPEAVTLESDDVSTVKLPFPLIVKPTREDASVGISRTSVVHDRRQLASQVAVVRAQFHQPVLVERFIEGRELYVSLIGARPDALPMHEIDFSTLPADRPRIVSYLGKWDPSSVEYRGTRSVKAVGLDDATRDRCVAAARAAFFALGLRDYARVDLRLAKDGTPYVIDVNPNCDLSDGAGVSRAASFGGVSYTDLVWRVCKAALARTVRESDPHVDRKRQRPKARVAAEHSAPADAAAAPTERPRRARGADRGGRAVHPGRGAGRARAHRPRPR
jgi:D-alanine-D-alanine ligase